MLLSLLCTSAGNALYGKTQKSYFKVTAGRYLLDLFNAHCCNLICLLCLHFSEQKKALRCRFHYPSLSLKQLLKVLFNSHQRLFGYGQLTSVRGKKICASHRRRGGLKMSFCCFSVSDQRSSFTTPLEPAEQYVAKPHPTALCLQLHKTRTFFFKAVSFKNGMLHFITKNNNT